MKRMTYLGPYADGVYVPDLDADIKYGETIDVADDLVSDLTAAGFQPAAKKKED